MNRYLIILFNFLFINNVFAACVTDKVITLKEGVASGNNIESEYDIVISNSCDKKVYWSACLRKYKWNSGSGTVSKGFADNSKGITSSSNTSRINLLMHAKYFEYGEVVDIDAFFNYEINYAYDNYPQTPTCSLNCLPKLNQLSMKAVSTRGKAGEHRQALEEQNTFVKNQCGIFGYR